MRDTAGLDNPPTLAESEVGADGAAQVVGLAAAHRPWRIEVVTVRVTNAVATYREGRLRDDDPGERVGNANVVHLVKKGQEPVVLEGLLPVPVLDDGEDLGLLLDDTVMRLRHPPPGTGETGYQPVRSWLRRLAMAPASRPATVSTPRPILEP